MDFLPKMENSFHVWESENHIFGDAAFIGAISVPPISLGLDHILQALTWFSFLIHTVIIKKGVSYAGTDAPWIEC
ncbi:hypothetical protein CHISP_3155 [Chitinispirillum alkaliphilum]|nr:hypothetical protein CHISP_3155 [Chitinispirillum alkaliphilum]